MTLLELLKVIVLGVGRLLVADAVASAVLGLHGRFQLLEIAIGIVLLGVSRSLLPTRSLLAVIVGWSALLGLLRIAYWVLRGAFEGAPHPFGLLGYAWRIVLFLSLGAAFVVLTRNTPRGRAA